MKIGIIGIGIVGGAVKHGLERLGHDVIPFDPKLPGTALANLLDAEVTFICVPTPQGADGECDTSIVEKVVAELVAERYAGLITIKSTVPPGTTQRLADKHAGFRFAFCPEFLRERAAVVDFYENHDVCIIGLTRHGQGTQDSGASALTLAHGNLPQHIAIMTSTEAELAKYYSNVFNALRVIFANEFFEVCGALGADYSRIKAAMVKRPTIVDSYMDCNPRFRGFGGVCLPKDTAAFAALVRRLGLDLTLFQTIVDENKKFTTTVPDGMRP